MQITKYEGKSKIKQMLKELGQSEHFELFWLLSKLSLMEELKSMSIALRQKSTKEIIINHKGTRMVKDGED